MLDKNSGHANCSLNQCREGYLRIKLTLLELELIHKLYTIGKLIELAF